MKDFKKNLKALALLLGLAVAMPFSAQAQTTKSMYHEGSLMDDPTAKWQSQGLMNDRTAFNDLTFSVTNNGIGQPDTTPLGSGLLILGAAGAGYALAKRRKNKKNNKNGVALLMASLMLLGFTQCKKEVIEPVAEGTTYRISIPAGGNNTRANVDPTGASTYATVSFEQDDKLYIGYNGSYVGYITYNGTNSAFEGNIDVTLDTENHPLDLYFLGGKDFTTTVSSNTATVTISDQSSHYPVISYAPTKTNFLGNGTYEATLLNKCSIMKFNVTTPSTAAICITGMNNKVTVDFSKVAETGTGLTGSTTDNGFSYEVNSTDGGLIKMPAKDASNVTWAIVLPQPELAAGSAGSIYAQNGTYTTFTGSRPLIHAIEANGYYHEGGDVITMTVNTATDIIDLGDVTDDKIIENGKTVIGTLCVNKKVSIADGATVTLKDVNINGSGTWTSGNYAGITCAGDATITLEGTNTVKGFANGYPGIFVSSGKTLVINGTGELNASSNGSYNTGSGGAGIGGGDNMNCGNIVIQSGTVTATGNQYGAGIGGGQNANCGNISISGGTVNATGGYRAAGIGGGRRGVSGNPGQYDSGSCGNITISGGTINATGGQNAAGIGGGRGNNVNYQSSCGTITITSGVTSVTATKGSGADNSIGAGNVGTCGTVTIGGSTGAITTSPYTYPVPITYPIALSAATSDYVGSVITTDGNVFATVADATAASKTAVAMIAYISSTGHGLALALADESTTMDWSTAISTCSGKTPTVTGGTWRLPSIVDWQYMFIGCGASGSVNDNPNMLYSGGLADNLNTAQGTALRTGSNVYYWSSTDENALDNTRAWQLNFNNSIAYFYNTGMKTSSTKYVRACLAF